MVVIQVLFSDLVTGFRNGHLILLDEVDKFILIRQQNFTCPLNVSPGHGVLMVKKKIFLLVLQTQT